ncbi:MAG: HAD family hydrolase [Sphingobacteriales bacterium]|nr:HAD family hydrolase [Sphingobacteriales bacterium]
MNKAIFFDRDGVIISERGDYNFLPEHIDFVEDIVESCQILQEKGYLLIVITNQAGIAKRRYQHKHVMQMHKIISNFFKSYGVHIHDFFYCPHHESTSRCLCRKPGTLLLEKAIAMYQIDPKQSFLIGDSPRDVEAAENAGIRALLIEKNTSLLPYIGNKFFDLPGE